MVAARRALLQTLSSSRASSYVCRSCRHQLSQSSLVIQQQRSVTNSRNALPTMEKVHSRVIDPTNSHSLASRDGAAVVESRHAHDTIEQDVEEMVAQGEEVEDTQYTQPGRDVQDLVVTVDIEEAPGYTPADTWQGLQYVGSAGNWRDMLPRKEDEFSSWIGPTANTAQNREQLVSCLRQTLLEFQIIGSKPKAQSVDEVLNTRLNRQDSPTQLRVLRRFAKLSGHHIPDPILNNLLSSDQPLSYLIDQLVEKVVQAKSKKLADLLMQRPHLNNQGNVMIFPRRETSIDKEKEVGRWKIIERELRDRGLPVSGGLKHL